MLPFRWELIILSCVQCAKVHNRVFCFWTWTPDLLVFSYLAFTGLGSASVFLVMLGISPIESMELTTKNELMKPGMHISKSKVWRTEESLLQWQHSCTDEERSHMANFACRYIICRLKTMALAPTELIWLDSWMKEKASFQLHHWASGELAPPLASCNTVGASARCSQAATKQNRSKASRHQGPRAK